MTLYEELELTPDCSFEDIKQQYRTLARQHHPDLGGDEEKFKRIKFAYEVLSDPIRRKEYDEKKTTGEQVPIHIEAINTLATIFFSIIPNFNCNDGNLIDAMRNEITTSKNKAVTDSNLCDNYIRNIELVKSKLKHNTPEKENIILSFIEKQLEARQRDKELFAYRIKLSDEMLLILDDYSYGFIQLINDMPVMESETNIQ